MPCSLKFIEETSWESDHMKESVIYKGPKPRDKMLIIQNSKKTAESTNEMKDTSCMCYNNELTAPIKSLCRQDKLNFDLFFPLSSMCLSLRMYILPL
jgi:hypothetical protein